MYSLQLRHFEMRIIIILILATGCSSTKPSKIHSEIENGNTKNVKLLIENGANLEEVTHSKWTPVHSAIRYGQEDILGLLVSSGANIEAKDSWSKTPLNRAVFFKYNLAEKLLISGAEVNAKDVHVSGKKRDQKREKMYTGKLCFF